MENRVHIFDTTLRDGEQSPGCSMNLEEKLKLAHQLEALQVDVIEAGFDDNDLVYDSVLGGYVPAPDGILGNSPVTVDDEGRVIRSADNTTSQGYFKPKDGDDNGVEDYREVGGPATIITDPLTERVEENDTITLGTVVEFTENVVYEWYETRDSGKVWIKLPPLAPYDGVDTDTCLLYTSPSQRD